LKTSRLIFAAAVLVLMTGGLRPSLADAADKDSRVNIAVDCHCPDSVGAGFCVALKHKISESPGYRLVPTSSTGFGIGVHLASIDLWQGINAEMAGRISAVSIAFTIFAEKLPGEVYADSSVFRVGKDTFPEMSMKIIGALGQIVNLNANLFNQMRRESLKPAAPPPTLKPLPMP
jgi:hypothetical protein